MVLIARQLEWHKVLIWVTIVILVLNAMYVNGVSRDD